ncbi:MAG: hypothetical protein WCJ51_01970 [Candidatus Moraniibacteriota bacterium]
MTIGLLMTLLLSAMVFSASTVLADDVTVDNSNANTNNVIVNSSVNSDATGGNVDFSSVVERALLNSPEHNIGTPTGLIDAAGYGTSVATSNFSFNTGQGYRIWTLEKHRVMINAMEKANGAVSWGRMQDLMILYPDIERDFSPMNGPVYYFDNALSLQAMRITEENIVGLLTYDTEASKKYFVPKNYLQHRSCYDAGIIYGGNIVVKVGDYSEGVFYADASNRTLGGAFSGLIGCVTGGAISGGVGGANTQNSKSIKNGAVYAVLRIDNPQFTVPPIAPPVIKRVCNIATIKFWLTVLLDRTKNCPTPCGNNQLLRLQRADLYLFWWHCTGEKDRELLGLAIKEYKIAERDFENGREKDGTPTSASKEGKALDASVRWNHAYAVYMLEGESSAVSFAKKNKMREVPTEYSDLKIIYRVY